METNLGKKGFRLSAKDRGDLFCPKGGKDSPGESAFGREIRFRKHPTSMQNGPGRNRQDTEQKKEGY